MDKKPLGLYVASTGRESFGKTALCVGLSLLVKEEGLKVGFFKPFGWSNFLYKNVRTDEDAALMKELLNLEEDIQTISPIVLSYFYLEKLNSMDRSVIFETIEKSFERVSEDKDIVLVEALHELSSGKSVGLSTVEIANYLGLSMLLVSSVQRDYVIDEIIFDKSYIIEKNVQFLGLIMNNVSVVDLDRIKRVYTPILEKSDVKIWGVIPENSNMRSPTGSEVKEHLKAEVLTCEEILEDILVENYIVGAMTPDSALRYFRATPRKAVITGGDRPDICLVALETDTSILVLTGNLRPSPLVLSKAKERNVPVLLVPYDTYTTVSMLQDIAGKIRYGDNKRINLAKQLVAENVNWRGLLKELERKCQKC